MKWVTQQAMSKVSEVDNIKIIPKTQTDCMNKYELRIIAATGILLMSFLFAVLYAAYAKKIDVPACIPYNATFKEPRVKQVDDKTYEVYAVARNCRNT